MIISAQTRWQSSSTDYAGALPNGLLSDSAPAHLLKEPVLVPDESKVAALGHSRVLSRPASAFWSHAFSKESIFDLEAAGKCLDGKPLTDLGAGIALGHMFTLAFEFGASNYIAVDTRYGGGSMDSLRSLQIQTSESCKRSTSMQVSLASQDILRFLRELKDESTCITINAIDDIIFTNYNYHQDVANQMARVCPKGGLIFGFSSNSLPLISGEFYSQGGDLVRKVGDSPHCWREHLPLNDTRTLIIEKLD